MPNVGSELDDLIKSAPKSVAYILSILLIIVAAALKITRVLADRASDEPKSPAAPAEARRAPDSDADTPFTPADGGRPKVTPPPQSTEDGE